MTRITTFTVACGLAFATQAPAALAQGADTRERTIMTFSGTAEMPGLSLEPGTYVFKLADTTLRNVVQVWDQEERNILGQWFFVPAERREPTDDTFIAFRETPAGTTPAIQYWYYPGQLRGKEFVYPKEQASRIAKATGQKVLTDEAQSTVASTDSPSSSTERELAGSTPSTRASSESNSPAPSTTSTASPTPSTAPPTPSAASSTISRDSSASAQQSSGTIGSPTTPMPSTAPVRSEPESQIARNELPQTASPLALTALIAVASIGTSMMVRLMRRRRALRA